jgi:hypothetical protein
LIRTAPAVVTGPYRRAAQADRKRLRNLDAFLACLGSQRVTPGAGQAHPLVRQHRLDQRFDAVEIGIVSGERVRIDHEERLPDAGLIARVDKKAIGLETHRGTG